MSAVLTTPERLRAKADQKEGAAWDDEKGRYLMDGLDHATSLRLLADAYERLEALLDYAVAVERRLVPWVATRPGVASFPDGGAELGETTRGLLLRIDGAFS